MKMTEEAVLEQSIRDATFGFFSLEYCENAGQWLIVGTPDGAEIVSCNDLKTMSKMVEAFIAAYREKPIDKVTVEEAALLMVDATPTDRSIAMYSLLHKAAVARKEAETDELGTMDKEAERHREEESRYGRAGAFVASVTAAERDLAKQKEEQCTRENKSVSSGSSRKTGSRQTARRS